MGISIRCINMHKNYQDVEILLVRHAESEANADPIKYTEISNLKIGLTDLGWQQAGALGKFINVEYQSANIQNWDEIKVYNSPCARTLETFNAVRLMSQLSGEPTINGNARLIEKFFGATNNLFHNGKNGDPKIDEKFVENLQQLVEMSYKTNNFDGKNLLGESTADIFEKVTAFIPGNADAIKIRGRGEDCTIHRVYDGKNMTAIIPPEDIKKDIRPIALDDIKSPPAHLKMEYTP